MSKETQIMNGATVPTKGSQAKEKDDVDQFPGQKISPKHKSEHRVLSFQEFISDKCCKFNTKTVEKDAMDGVKPGADDHDTLDGADKTAHTSMK